jgi:hypothetical protein
MNRNTAVMTWREVCGSDTVMAMGMVTGRMLEDFATRIEAICQPEGLKFDAFGQPRTRYVRVSLNGSRCVMHPSEGDCYVEEARNSGDPDWERYEVRDVWLSEREFEDLGEFDGF